MDKPICSECDEPIEGEQVWCGLVPDSGEVIGTATSWPVTGQEIPFHPECFEFRTGQTWPPDNVE